MNRRLCLRITPDLARLVTKYQTERRLPSVQAAIVELASKSFRLKPEYHEASKSKPLAEHAPSLVSTVRINVRVAEALIGKLEEARNKQRLDSIQAALIVAISRRLKIEPTLPKVGHPPKLAEITKPKKKRSLSPA